MKIPKVHISSKTDGDALRQVNAEFEVRFHFSILKNSFETGEMKAEYGALLIKTFHFDLLS